MVQLIYCYVGMFLAKLFFVQETFDVAVQQSVYRTLFENA